MQLWAIPIFKVEVSQLPLCSPIVFNCFETIKAPTSGDRVKSSVQRLKQWDTIQKSIAEFKDRIYCYTAIGIMFIYNPAKERYTIGNCSGDRDGRF